MCRDYSTKRPRDSSVVLLGWTPSARGPTCNALTQQNSKLALPGIICFNIKLFIKQSNIGVHVSYPQTKISLSCPVLGQCRV